MKFKEIKEHLSRYTVGIAGAGGLGSNCAVALARSGIGRLIIADFDIVEESNLNRQYFFTSQTGMKKIEALKANIAKINPGTHVETHDTMLNEKNIISLFKECHIIIEAFDSSNMKELIAHTVMESLPDKVLVMGSGLAGFGNNNSIRERKIDDRLYICGDGQSETNINNPPLAPRVGIVANMQANIVVELLMKEKNEDHS